MAAAAAALVTACAGPDYVAVEGGAQHWQAASNDYDLEAGSELGWMAGAAIGRRLSLRPGVSGRLEVELQHRANAIHGRNGAGCRQRSCSADALGGNTLHVTAVTMSFWPGLRVGPVELYAGGGAGAAALHALGDRAIAPVGQVGAGVLWPMTSRWSVDAGWRAVKALTSPTLDGQRTEYLASGPMLRLTFALAQEGRGDEQ